LGLETKFVVKTVTITRNVDENLAEVYESASVQLNIITVRIRDNAWAKGLAPEILEELPEGSFRNNCNLYPTNIS